MTQALLGLLLVLVAAIATRFAPFSQALPGWLPSAVTGVVGGVLLIVGLLERRLPHGEVGPLWMRVPRPVSLCLAAGLSYFTTVLAQTLGLSLGPVDPTFPTTVPTQTAAVWFFMFTIGFLGIGMMSAPALMVPLVRVLTWPFARAPLAVGVAVAVVAGATFSVAFVTGAQSPLVVELIARWRALFDENPTWSTVLLVGIAVVPQVVGALLPSREG